ncbi:TPA: hypothetical protein DDZ10_00575 [Candidatus Uhrbacteria bacterium]|nr:MAG: hypothetical protein UY79_C0013G0002 [Parcubacteria group bacterium GW2011_GWA2_53_21]OGL72286.1 MAG: hypothetical protein A3D69_03755 [Candidatus Uhrbacteria bacterium RIFCSPHIGHO2_02_FULL_54_11]OGU44031.1 MAG: hypothetical protein A2X68_05225 [Ignavibacteria bacterium GWC2_56_12]HBL39154.1 hypothetical protein [Candidatus Uhrbacteria bacterium]
MKNQYFGDFGDYQKFSLLKHLRDFGGFRILVHWMKTKDDGTRDGKHIAYLEKPQTWDGYDKDVYYFLKAHRDKNERDLALFENSAHALGISFANDHIEDSANRLRLMESLSKDKNSEIVFFDPDNGIEVKSMTEQNKHKYVLWSEIDTAYRSEKSVLIYQHFSRMNRDKFIDEKVKDMVVHFSIEPFVIQVKHSVYFLLPQKKHVMKIKKALQDYNNSWKTLTTITDPYTSKSSRFEPLKSPL